MKCVPKYLPEAYVCSNCWLPYRDDDNLFAAARLIITALIARIHTVEWTTAIIQHPAGRASQVSDTTRGICL